MAIKYQTSIWSINFISLRFQNISKDSLNILHKRSATESLNFRRWKFIFRHTCDCGMNHNYFELWNPVHIDGILQPAMVVCIWAIHELSIIIRMKFTREIVSATFYWYLYAISCQPIEALRSSSWVPLWTSICSPAISADVLLFPVGEGVINK